MFSLEPTTEALSSRPAACSWGPNRLDIFWADSAGKLRHRWFDAEGWHAAEILPTRTPLASAPAVCAWSEGRIDIFWRESSGALHHKWYDRGWGSSGVGNEESFPAAAMPATSAPAACSWGRGRIDVFWRNSDGTLHQKWYEGEWHDTDFPSNALASDPAACSWGLGRIDLFWRNNDGTLHQKWHSAGWHDVESLGGSFVGAPTACAWPGVVDVFVRKADNTLHHIWHEGGWHPWLQREGRWVAEPAAVSWGDGRLDIFGPGTDGFLWHGWHGSVPLATHGDAIKSLWGFLSSYTGADKLARLHGSFAAGLLNGNCSGAMISPHIFMSAAHCGGPGWTGAVNFYRMNQFALPPDERSQQLSAPYLARTFPWQQFSTPDSPMQGDMVLWWLPDGPDGIPPGIKYGYLELSGTTVEIGTNAYSFWSNPALRADHTLLYSDGPAASKYTDTRGPVTDYNMWVVGGSSGSPVLSGAHNHGVVGVTSTGPNGGMGRQAVDTTATLQRFDVDRNVVADPVDYDWLFTQPIQPFYLLTFDTPFQRTRWVAHPGGSGTSVGPMYALAELPRMTGRRDKATEGFWHHFARFTPGATYRLSVVASGTQSGNAGPSGASYIKFRSDSTGHEVRFGFTPFASGARFVGRVTLGNNADYRLIVGTEFDTTLVIESLAIVADNAALGFETHDERLSWEYTGQCRPTSWGTRGADNFSGAVIGPTPDGWGIRNRHVGLMPSTRYRVSYVAKHVSGPRTAGNCYLRIQDLGTGRSAENRFTFASDGEVQTFDFTFTTPASPVQTIGFGTDTATTFLVSDLRITPI